MEVRRPLKRNLPRLGPPDIYPQDPKQKEDELTSVNVKQGYTSAPLVSGPNNLDEFGTAKNANIDAFGVYFSALLSEKHRINTIKDTQKKKQLVNTNGIWYVHAKTKNAVDNWFRDLANRTKSLSQLGKRIPIFNNKEGMFSQLFESNVPFAKAVWFIKMSAVHAIAQSESSSKSKKRQAPDQYQELTSALTKYLKEIMSKLVEYYQQHHQQQQTLTQQLPASQQPQQQQAQAPSTGTNNSQSILAKISTHKPATSSKTPPLQSGPTNGSHQQHRRHHPAHGSTSSLLNSQSSFTSNLHTSVATLVTSHTASAASLSASSLSQWPTIHEEFIPTLSQWQYQTQLARYLFDEGLLDRYDFLCFILELIEKKRSTNDLVVRLICPLILEYVIDFSKSAVLSRRLAHLCAKKLCHAMHHQNSATGGNSHKDVIHMLSSVLHVICIECPTAMVRHHIVEPKSSSSTSQGSPLDHLPCLPSNLPMLDSDLNSELRRSVQEAEREILYRSAMADSKWSCCTSRKAETSKAVFVNRLLTVLDLLDKHNFDKLDSTNSYDLLYARIFPSNEVSKSSTQSNSDSSATANTSSTDQNTAYTPTPQNPTLEFSKKSKHQQAPVNLTSSSSKQQSTEHADELNCLFFGDQDEHVIRLLCEWATTTQRTGEHRALIVARLLEKRQAELLARNQGTRNNSVMNDKKSEDLKSQSGNNHNNINNNNGSQVDCSPSAFVSDTGEPVPMESDKDEQREDIIEYVFQDLLVQFLDENAPMIETNQSTCNGSVDRAFNNLVLLFSELIRCDVFSHYNYMCTLISRGMFNELSLADKGPSFPDSHIDDVDADLGKILQDIKEGQQDEAADILLPDYLGGLKDDSNNKAGHINKLSPFGLSDRPSSTLENGSSNSPNVMSSNHFPTNPVDSKSMGISSNLDEKDSPKNTSEFRHMTFVKHFPVPDDENFARDINQRNILLYGFGKEREEARHAVKRLNKEICKLLGRRASRDINDGGKIKKVATIDGFNPESTLQKFESLNSHDQHIITNSLSTLMLEMFTGVSNGQTFSLPTLEAVSFIFDLFSIASNVSGLLELVLPILEELPDVEAQIKLKCPLLANQYTHSIALCIIGMLYQYQSCVLLMPRDEIRSVFESLHKLISHVQNPVICTTSTERVIFHYLYDLHSQTGRLMSQYSSLMQKIKQQLQSGPSLPEITVVHEWTPTILTNIISQLRTSPLCSNSSTNPILNAGSSAASLNNFSPFSSDDLTTSIRQQFYLIESSSIKQMNDLLAARYRFVCDAIYLSATSSSLDLVNDIAVLCSDVTAKCPPMVIEWYQALQALLIHGKGELSYSQLLNKINISELQVMENITIFTAVLIARRCIQLDTFIYLCAIKAIATMQNPVDKHLKEPGIRLTCHLLLALFRNRESASSQLRPNQQSTALYGSRNAFGQSAFHGYGSNTPNYTASLLGPVSHMSLLHSIGGGSSKDSCTAQRVTLNLKYLCDHHLLRAVCCNIKTEYYIVLLKAIRVLANASSDTDLQGRSKPDSHIDDSSLDIIAQMTKNPFEEHANSPSLMTNDAKFDSRHINLQTASLHQFADATSRLICSQRWLHDKCLSDSEILTSSPILLDNLLTIKQTQQLLYMICYNKSPEIQAEIGLEDQGSDQVASLVKMFENLDVWSMRLSLMRLQFMLFYCTKSQPSMLNEWLDNLAKAVVEFFQKVSQEYDSKDEEAAIELSGTKRSVKSASSANVRSFSAINFNKVWLIEPLLNKLSKPPSIVQSKIIRASASLMESASVRANSLPSLNQTYLSTAAASTKFKERTLSQRGSASTNPSNLGSTSLLGFQPFLSLLLSCLKNQDKERETLLTSLNSQLYQAIHEKVDDIGYKQSLQDGLELRLCLIGRMFETIQKSPNLTCDWATLLLLLIMNNLVDPQIDYGLYVTVLDMLAMLIHSAYACDPVDQKEDNRKQYQGMMKKIKKELTAMEEKGFIQMKLITPLMPLQRQMTEVITCEPMGSLVDTKGEKVENFYSIDKKKGLKVSELQEVSPWDLIEGHKNPAPLCWPWFGAVKLEHKPLKADENNRLMSWHTHTIRHSTQFYCDTLGADDGPSSVKRGNLEKKPSQSNPLLKSLIEANDDPPSLKRKDIDSHAKAFDEDSVLNDELGGDLEFRDGFVEDYCELPPDMLFDAAPVESLIEDIKTAMQAEKDVISSRSISKPIQTIEPKPPIAPSISMQASSILAPVQPDANRPVQIVPPPISAVQLPVVNAIQNHSKPAPVVNIVEPKPKAPRKRRVTKKDPQQQQQAPPQIIRQANITPVQQQQLQRQRQTISPFQQLPHQQPHHHPHAQVPQMQMNMQVQQPQQHIQQQHQLQHQQHMQQQPIHQSHHQIQYQQQAQHQHAQAPPGQQHIQAQQIRLANHQQPLTFQPVQQQQRQQQQQHLLHHHHHHQQQQQQQQQQQHPVHGSTPQMQINLQSTSHSLGNHQQQHHQIQYQPQGQTQQGHIQHQQHIQQQQQIRLPGHQQSMPFAPIQHPHQQQQQQQQQQHLHQSQMFTPQQTAGHSRPALTAMLHQKHAAAGNMQCMSKPDIMRPPL